MPDATVTDAAIDATAADAAETVCSATPTPDDLCLRGIDGRVGGELTVGG